MIQLKDFIADIPSFYIPYMQPVKQYSHMEALEISTRMTVEYLQSVSDEKGLFSYGKGKWTINELVRHITDADTVFMYRSLWIVRNAKGDLSGFDHNHWVAESNANQLSLSVLLEQYKSNRQAIIDFFRPLGDEGLKRTGTANGFEIRAIMLPYIMSGHNLHHLDIIKKRYLL